MMNDINFHIVMILNILVTSYIVNLIIISLNITGL